jgi:hypothetical protein
LFHICESNFVSYLLLVWTHPPWIALTYLCTIHGMMGVCNRFKIWKLLSQLLWTSGVAQHWRGCSPHKKKLAIFCPNHVFWLNSILQAMKLVKRFECCYLWIC